VTFTLFIVCLGLASPPDFTREVLPTLREHCFQCHSHETGKNKGGLVVDSASGLKLGGDGGPALNTQKPEQSPLLLAIRRQEGVSAMPPAKALPEPARIVLERWVLAGAPWPAESGVSPKPTKAARSGVITPTDRTWWAFQPLAPTAVSVRDAQSIDLHIDSSLKARGWNRASPADSADWLRRVTYDLTGLPPTPTEAKAFAANPDKTAAIDRLLASPHFGEKWGRFWLDLVRYAESDGYRADEFRPTAWRYRDWVVAAWNSDMPYDRFLRLQLAGDELEPNNPESLIALGYLRLGTYEYNQRDSTAQWNAILEDITDVTADVALGLGLACARCHDHKYDPLLQRDYHALKSFFSGLVWRDDVPVSKAEAERMLAWEKRTAQRREQLTKLEAPHRRIAFQDARALFPPELQKLLDTPREQLSPAEKQVYDIAYRQVQYEYDHLETRMKDAKAREEIKKLRLELKAETPTFATAQTVSEVGATVDNPTVAKRGKKPEPIAPGVPTVLDRLGLPAIQVRANSSGRRAALAQWLTGPENPLVPRVMVNRVWQRVFGKGLVATTSDWGTLGEKPSHPELLDGLTRGFIDGGWKLKPLIRAMVLSETYGQSSVRLDNPAIRDADSDNRYLWRGPSRRLDAEEVRDSLFASANTLDRTVGGPGVGDEAPRRSIYLKVRRNTRDPLLAAFDAADGLQTTPQRLPTVTVTQTLLLRNGPLAESQSAALGKLIVSSGEGDRIQALFLRALGRLPRPEEASAVENAVASHANDAACWTDTAHAVLESNAFLYLE
jgi:hypothetical protein